MRFVSCGLFLYIHYMEQWKEIEGYEGLYDISDKGRYYSHPRPYCKGGYGYGNERGKYLSLSLSNKTKKTKYIHVLVWEAFVGPVPDGYDVHHINHNTKDNRLENLCLIDKHTHITMHLNEHFEKFRKLSVKARSKPIIQYTLDGKFIREWESQAEASRQCGIHFGSISNCCLGRSKTAGGFIWRFKEG